MVDSNVAVKLYTINTFNTFKERGVIPQDVTLEDIIEIVFEQEVVNYSTSKGSITFDIEDFVY